MPVKQLQSLPSLAEIKLRWREALNQARPYLFNAAYQVIEAYPDRRWNILICDDASARLPSAFLQELFSLRGLELPLVHICANAVGRAQTGREVYKAYAEELLSRVTEPKALLISEAVGDGNGIRYLLDLFHEAVTEVDTVVVASYYHRPVSFGNVYVGGYGARFAVRAIYEAFEALRVTARQFDGSEEPLPGAILAGRQLSPLPDEPFIRPTDDPEVRALSAYCLGQMKELAAEYYRIETEEAGSTLLSG
jgi:hypothetical protein